ncbi:hypothetical protein [Conexibacter sp. DBS9H8]|uniref:hypothetical protein n=1 Tax=Conexibacter sp. DBS9H8 TaxID=2937801 RepID=UPI00200FC5FC|nr:hypothetical protein [Conexibacter sp. DBS9H8]
MASTAESAARAALLASLRAAIDALLVCADHLEAMIEQTDRLLGAHRPSAPVPPLSEISHGGGPSPLLADGPGPERVDQPAPDLGVRIPGRPPLSPTGAASPPAIPAAPATATATGPAVDPTGLPAEVSASSALLVAVDLAHRGYSREEISERLNERWGSRAAELLRRVMD